MISLYDEEVIQVGDETVRLAVDFRTLDFIEGLTGQAMPEILPVILAGGTTCPISLSGKVLKGLLLRHHPETTLDEAAGLMFSEEGNKVGFAMCDLLTRVFKLEDLSLTGEEKDQNPPKRRGRSRSSGKSG